MSNQTAAMKLALEALKKVHYEAINSGINNNALLVKEIAKAHAALAALAQPAQQPLTGRAIDEISRWYLLPHSTHSFVRAIEAAHGIGGTP